jgi:hypothetical protein
MKIETKIKLLGWIFIIWGAVGLFSRVFLPVLLLPLGVGLLLKNKICATITRYFAFFGIFMAILGIVSYSVAVLIPNLLKSKDSAGVGNQGTAEPNIAALLILPVTFIVVGIIFWFIHRFLKKPEVIAIFGKKQMHP